MYEYVAVYAVDRTEHTFCLALTKLFGVIILYAHVVATEMSLCMQECHISITFHITTSLNYIFMFNFFLIFEFVIRYTIHAKSTSVCKFKLPELFRVLFAEDIYYLEYY